MKSKVTLAMVLASAMFLSSEVSARDVWIGTAPACNASPSDCSKRGMTYIRKSKSGDGKKCWSGYKVLCRSASKASRRTGGNKNKKVKYKWIGTAPFCKGHRRDCARAGMEFVRYDKKGDGKKCLSGRKVLCKGQPGVWLGRAPVCNAGPADCARRGMRYIRSSQSGDGKKCVTGRKVFCSGRFKKRNPPYYVIAHMTNTPSSVNYAVSRGANAVEIDLSFHKNGQPSKFYHGVPCDCYPAVITGGVCKPLFRDATRQKHIGPGRACKAKGSVSGLLNHIASKPRLALVIIDSKVEAGLNRTRAGKNVIKTLDAQLFDKGFRGQVIVGVAKAANVSYLSAAARQAAKSRYRQRYYFSIDQETAVKKIVGKLHRLKLNKQVAFGTGISSSAPGGFYDQIVVAAQLEQDNKTSFTYIWTLDSVTSMKKYINVGARGVITNLPGKAYRLFRNMGLRLATPRHNLKPRR